MLVVMVTMLALGAYLKPLPKVGEHKSVILKKMRQNIYTEVRNALSNLGFSPVGARSLDRGEPEEHAPAALRPLLLVEKEQIGLRELKAWRAILRCLFFFSFHIFISFRRSLSPSVCGLCRSWPRSFSACRMELLLEWARPSWW